MRGLSRLPGPTGPVPVGTEVLSLALDAPPRSITIRVWYPAARARGARAPYAFGAGTSLREHVLAWLVRSDAIRAAIPKSGKFPVVLYVPGLGGTRVTNSALAQDLASHGYVIVALDDTGPRGGFDFAGSAAIARTLAWSAEKVRLQAADISGCLDAIATARDGPARSVLAELGLDHDRIAVIGFSFGGAVAAEAAVSDTRIAAAVNLDGWLFGRALHAGVEAPFLVVSTDDLPAATSNSNPANLVDEASFDRFDVRAIAAGLDRHGGDVLTIVGSAHDSFTDATLLPSIRRRQRGTIEPSAGHEIVARYVRVFLNRELKGITAPALDDMAKSDGSGVSLKCFTRPDTLQPIRG